MKIYIVKWAWNIERVYDKKKSAQRAVQRMRKLFPLVDPREFDVIERNIITSRWPRLPLY